MILLDIIADPSWYRNRTHDTIDTIAAPVQDIVDTSSSASGSSTTIWTVVITILSLAICLLMAFYYRQRVRKSVTAATA